MRIRCHLNARRMIPALYGELSEARRTAFEKHLSSCRKCREEFDSLKATLTAVRAASARLEPSPASDLKILEAARNRNLQPSIKPVWFFRPLPAAVAVSIVVVGLFAVFRHQYRSTTDMYSTIAGQQSRPEGISTRAGKPAEDVSSRTQEFAAPKAEQNVPNLYFYKEKKSAPGEALPKDSASKGMEAPAPAKRKIDTDRLADPVPDVEFTMDYRFDDFSSSDKAKALGYTHMDEETVQHEMQARSGEIHSTESKAPEIAKPVLIKRVEPVFPGFARQHYQAGQVVLEAEISSDGKVTGVRLVQSLESLCDQAAVDAVSQWEFSPGMVGGKPVKTHMIVTVTFKTD